jgi:hypothetical protein
MPRKGHAKLVQSQNAKMALIAHATDSTVSLIAFLPFFILTLYIYIDMQIGPHISLQCTKKVYQAHRPPEQTGSTMAITCCHPGW